MMGIMERTYRHIPISHLSGDGLAELSGDLKLSLSREDMTAVQVLFGEWGREPTDVELEVIAQTWSEHCKHRIFGAEIRHRRGNGEEEVVDGLFRTFVKEVTDEIRKRKPDFVLGAFDDNAGFVRLDENLAVCLKVETHNHPSAIEPYAGANTGLGGVIRDILGAGKVSRPIASLDVFCFGPPDTAPEDIRGEDVIHPVGILRGVVRGVRDYGNRMGIPTVAGAIQFDPAYIYNPLVYCGTAGVIPIPDIAKEVKPGHKVVAVGGRTGRDGLKGATFSSAALDSESHEEDQQAVQIGNPIEEKKVSDFLLEARERGWIECVTDCGAGGFSSAAGEMLSECGGELDLDAAPLKEEGLLSWEVFISESQERMVLAVKPDHVEELKELAGVFGTELCVLGTADGTGVLTVRHRGEVVCELDNSKLHEAPRQHRSSHWETPSPAEVPELGDVDRGRVLRDLLGDFAICSRAPVIREYDHEVQGNTYLKPLAGARGDAPQDGSVLRIDGSERLLALGLSVLPEWGKTDPHAMGLAVVDECMRQLVCLGADPQRVALLDNFCLGNPDDPRELGALVEACRGMAEAALAYEAPFVSGKDSFYNYFEVDGDSISIPVTLLLSGMGVIDGEASITGSSLRAAGSKLLLLGKPCEDLGGSVLARRLRLGGLRIPLADLEANRRLYAAYHEQVSRGRILSAHDVGEGGVGVALAEMSFSEVAGIRVEEDLGMVELFGEGPGRIVAEVEAEDVEDVLRAMRAADVEVRVLGETTSERTVRIGRLTEDVAALKEIWKTPLATYY